MNVNAKGGEKKGGETGERKGSLTLCMRRKTDIGKRKGGEGGLNWGGVDRFAHRTKKCNN